jgi:3-deoxy-D-manno-octulosonate 8-phosphate phosphatase (KDO 8-P phosphatase)
VVTDVDGVLTDSMKYYGPGGLALLAFHVRDGLGLHLLKRMGMHLAIVTVTDSDIVSRRAADLGITEVFRNVRDKRTMLRTYREANKLSREEVLYVGDDLWDLEAFAEVGVRVAVADAVLAVRAAADWVTECTGGSGALREIADAIVEAKGIDPVDLLRPQPRREPDEGSADTVSSPVTPQ